MFTINTSVPSDIKLLKMTPLYLICLAQSSLSLLLTKSFNFEDKNEYENEIYSRLPITRT